MGGNGLIVVTRQGILLPQWLAETAARTGAFSGASGGLALCRDTSAPFGFNAQGRAARSRTRRPLPDIVVRQPAATGHVSMRLQEWSQGDVQNAATLAASARPCARPARAEGSRVWGSSRLAVIAARDAASG